MTETAPDELVAVDVHTHVLASTYRAGPEDPALKSLASVFGFDHVPTLPEMIDYYRARNMAFVTFTVDDVTRAGVEPSVGNLEILDLAGKYPDVVIPFASVDPNRGTAAVVRIATELLDEHGARGLKFHPSQQQFYPNDRAHYPLYELLAERGLPALFHTGTTGVGRGQPGGGGIRLKYSNPMYLDDVAADFSELPIIMAHPSFPWQEEALAVATHKPQVYIDLSGWSPKYFPPVLVQHINTLLKDRVLFGSDFPLITPDRWIRDFDTLGVKPEVRSLVLRENAMRLLDLSDLLEARRVRQAEDALSSKAVAGDR
jgi:predicted TIM-barrel fold metal-dependent hydrolase